MTLFDDKPKRGALSLADLADSTSTGIGLASALRGALSAEAPPSTQTTLGALAKALLAPRPGTEEFVQAVWDKASIDYAYDATRWRRDPRGALIARNEHGLYTPFGWHMDHIIPKALDGSDELYNRQALHWSHNLAKSDRLF